jgi:GWxTD domain-containing protein
VVFFACLSYLNLFAQISDRELPSYRNASKYFLEILDFSSGQENITRIDVFIQVPYSSVRFIKKDTLFIAGYKIVLSVFDENKEKLIMDKTWSEKIQLTSFDQTISKDNASLAMRSFFLLPGKYFLRIELNDNESKAEYSKEEFINVRNLSGEVSLSDIMLLAKRKEEEGKNKIVPYVSLNVANFKSGLPLFYEIYSKKPQKIEIEYSISNDKNKIFYTDSASKYIDSGKTQIIYTLKDSSFSLGNYNLTVELRNSNNQIIAAVRKKFYSRWVGVPSTITDLDQAINEMIYIASTSQIGYIKNASTNEEKKNRFLEFWKQQDPVSSNSENPYFIEYYNRVAYANEHFSQYFPGWRSDRGMVFILLGPPDNIERYPFEMNSKPYEIWTYYQLNVSLVFVDQTGFGDYRLITPLTGDLNRFRL